MAVVTAEYVARDVHGKQHWASHWVSCGPMLGVQKLWDLRIVEKFSDSRQLFAPGTCPMI